MNILLAVCGSISAYKAYDLTRAYIKEGHNVKVILTRGALEFIMPKTFKFLGAKEVFYSGDDFEYPKNNQDFTVLHIELAKWCDKFVIAPISAGTISRLVHASASDLLSSVFISLTKDTPVLIYPAMNTQMLDHPFVQENIEQLKKLNSLEQVFIHPTDSGTLACGDIGKGKLPQIEEIVDTSSSFAIKSQDKKRYLITCGATISPLDPVRYLTNPSSGITGYHFAKDLLSKGHIVHIIAGVNATDKLENLVALENFKITRIKTTENMYESVFNSIKEADVYISSAAVSDIKFELSPSKMKKEQITTSLPISKSIDILEKVIQYKNESKQDLKIVGFAAETDLSPEILMNKFNKKPVDLLVGTLVSNGLNSDTAGFKNENADYKIMKDGDIVFTGNLSKKDLINKITEGLK